MRTALYLTGAGLAALLIACLLKRDTYIDVQSGGGRSCVLLLDVPVSIRTFNTAFSNELKKHHEGQSASNWQLESRTSIFSHVSPNVAYLGAFMWEDGVMYSFELSHADDATRIDTMRRFISLLSSNPRAAMDYATELQVRAASKQVTNK